MIRISKAKNNAPTAYLNGRPLLSRHNPQEEVRRYIDKTLSEPYPPAVIIIGDILNYFAIEIKRRCPTAIVISLHFDRRLIAKTPLKSVSSYIVEQGAELHGCLAAHLTELDVHGLQIIEWMPSVQAFPKQATVARQAAADLLNMQNGNISTTAFFGRRWIRNAFKNFLSMDEVGRLPQSGKPILIAASGPTLAKSIPYLKEHRSSVMLWALPSAVSASLDSLIEPDLVVLTDPGYYSLLHFYPLEGFQRVPIAMPLTATKSVRSFSSLTIPINQGFFFEHDLLSLAHIDATQVPPNGSVAGTALELTAGKGPATVIAGLDFAADDIHSHVRPHMFEPFLAKTTSRIDPLLTRKYGRSRTHQASHDTHALKGPLRTYADWFSRYLARSGRCVYRLFPSDVRIEGFVEMEGADLARLCRGHKNEGPVLLESTHLLPLKKRKSLASVLLSRWIASILQMQSRNSDLPVSTSSFFNSNELLLVYFVDARNVLKIFSEKKHIYKIGDFAGPLAATVSFLHEIASQINMR